MAKNAVMTAKDDAGVPAYLKNAPKVNNRDNFDQSDITVPRIKLLQSTSKEVEAHSTAKVGLFWHTGFDVALGPEFKFVVASRRKKLLLVAPMEDGQGILARAEDFITWDRLGKWDVKIKNVKKPVTWEISDLNVAASGLDQWGTFNPDDENSPPAATMFYEYLVLCPDFPELGASVVSLTRSAIRKAKKGLNDKIKLQDSAGRPMQSLIFIAKNEDDQNSDGQKYKNWSFVSGGFASEELFKSAVQLKDVMANYRVEGEEEAAHEESSAGQRATRSAGKGGKASGDDTEY